MHYKGNILIDRGLPGAPLSVGAIAVWNRIFARYPKIHIVGYYAGQYALGPEQAAVAALLTAHPHIDGLMSQAYGVGAIAALKAISAKPAPMIAATFNETMLACVQNHIGCLTSVNPTWLSGLAMKYAVDALDGRIGKTAQWVHDEVAPYSTNNVQMFAYSIVGVDLEQPDRRAAFQRQADDSCPVQSEVVTPLLFAWSEDAAELARVRIEGGEISPLVPIAAPAREGQVPRFGCSTVLLGDHMVHLVRKECHGGWEEAVLAA